MDVHILDILNKANTNIKELIERIVSLERKKDRNNCCYGALDNRPECKGNCDECKDEYYDKIYEDMIKEYNISY